MRTRRLTTILPAMTLAQAPLPGEASRAHHSILFLDARPECRRSVLEVLHQPLENDIIQKRCPVLG
jgi:predicted ATPase with chaperone activity